MFISAFLSLLISCSPASVPEGAWGKSFDSIADSLSKGDFSWFDEIPRARYSRILKSSPGAAWLFASHLQKAGRVDEARAFFRLAAQKSPEPWRSLALSSILASGAIEDRLEVAESALRSPSTDGSFPELQAASLAAERERLLFVSGRYSDVPEGVRWVLSRPLDRDLLSAVRTALEKPGIEGSWTELLRLRIAMAERDYGPAWTIARPVLENLPAGVDAALPRAVLSDLGNAAFRGAPDAAAARDLLLSAAGRCAALAQSDFREASHVLYFYAARLEEKTGGARSREFMDKAHAYADSAADRDSALWYRLDFGRTQSRAERLSDFVLAAPLWTDSPAFSNLLASFTAELVRAGDWKSLRELAEKTGPYADGDTQVRFDYLLARSGVLPPEEEERLLRAVWERDHTTLYYRLLAADALGIPLENPEGAVVRKKTSFSGDLAERQEEWMAVFRSLIEWKLPELVLPTARKRFPSLSPEYARELAEGLSEAGRYDDAALLVLESVRPADREITREDLSFIYPRPWLDLVEAARTEKVDSALLYGLIRTESFFRPAVSSGAGAQGLTQLMAGTAGDVARKLKVADYDLSDPATNIRFGAFYLDELIGRLDGNIMHALFAYNAGISRLRSWVRVSGTLPPDLFLESLPFAETRDYGRKVLAASAVYGYLYNQKNAGQAVRDIF